MPNPTTRGFQPLMTAYGSVLRSGLYRPPWLSQLVSNFGEILHYIAIVVLVFETTGQGISVAGLVAAEIMPVLLLGPVAGIIIDRFDRQSVLIGADLFRAILVFSLLWPQGLWHVYLVAAGIAAGNTFSNPTVQAVIPVLTSANQRLAANSVSWSTGRLVQILASAVAGGVIGVLGTRVHERMVKAVRRSSEFAPPTRPRHFRAQCS
jgi:MFS family permease